jgi:hypothetical protein
MRLYPFLGATDLESKAVSELADGHDVMRTGAAALHSFENHHTPCRAQAAPIETVEVNPGYHI